MTLSPSEVSLRARDPMEQRIERALIEAGIPYVIEGDRHPAMKGRHLDFYLPEQDVFIEVKRLHSDRTAQQMARASNVVVAQGEAAVNFLAASIRRNGAEHDGRAD